MIYAKFKIKNLDVIQQKVLKIIPTEFLLENKLSQIESKIYTRQQILQIEEIIALLIDMNVEFKNVINFSFTVVLPKTSIPIHIDDGEYTYSINIPIIGSDNSSVIFYKNKQTVELTNTDNNKFYKFKLNEVEKIGQVKSDLSLILNTKTPHSVINHSNDTRVILLMRLHKSVTFSDLRLDNFQIVETLKST